MAKKSNLKFMKKTQITPISEAGWASLTEPDEMSGKYQLEIKLDPKDAKWRAFFKDLLAFENQCLAEDGLPKVKECSLIKTKKAKPKKDEDGKPTGEMYDPYFYIKPTRKVDKGQPSVFDAKNNPISVGLVWGGSTVRAEISVAYTNSHMHTGLTCYLTSVQLLETPAGKAEGGSRFDEADGYDAIETSDDDYNTDGDTEAPFAAED